MSTTEQQHLEDKDVARRAVEIYRPQYVTYEEVILAMREHPKWTTAPMAEYLGIGVRNLLRIKNVLRQVTH